MPVLKIHCTKCKNHFKNAYCRKRNIRFFEKFYLVSVLQSKKNIDKPRKSFRNQLSLKSRLRIIK